MFNTITEVYDWIFNQKKINKRENLDRIKKWNHDDLLDK